MALLESYNIKNIVNTDDFKEEVYTRSVTVGGVAKTVVNRKVTASYQFVGLTRKSAMLCVQAKLAQYFRSRTMVNESGVLVTETAQPLANVVPVHIAGDDWGVDVQLNQEDEVFMPTDVEVGHSPVTIDDALDKFRRECYDIPIAPFNCQVHLPRAQYGTDATIEGNDKGFVLLNDGFTHSCFDAQSRNDYEAMLQWKVGDFNDSASWLGSITQDNDWSEGGIRFIGIPSYTQGKTIFMRLRIRSKLLGSTQYWNSNVICQLWGNRNIIHEG